MSSGKLLSGKTVLITGASRGVGETLGCTLARHGAKLILVSEQKSDLKQTEEKCKAEGCASCECCTCDLADPKGVQALANKVAGMGVDVAIVNAGIFAGGEDDLLKGNPDEWDRMMMINAAAPMRLIRALAPKMADKGGGTIICISDVEAFHTGPRHAAYAASMYALRGFCKSAYEALHPHNIRVMNIAVGNVAQTAMVEKTPKQAGQGAVDPNDIAEAVLLPFRCSVNCVPEEIVIKAVQPSGD